MSLQRDAWHEDHKHLDGKWTDGNYDPISIYYDNGCMICDMIEQLHGIALHGTRVPWSSEEYDEQQAVILIRTIKSWFGKPSETVRYSHLLELGL